MILFEDHQGLCARPQSQVSAIVPAYPNRFRIESKDGIVGYCYDPTERVQPGSCQYSTGKSFDPEQLRRIRTEDEALLLQLESGQELRVSPKWTPQVKQLLGLDHYRPQPETLTRLFLREYPFEIARATGETLKSHFSTDRQLIANLIWQSLEFRRNGQEKGYGDTHRGFWYVPVHATLTRCGLFDEQSERSYRKQIAQMVDEDALFCYRDLGFEDEHPDHREIGKKLPHVILVIEKDSVSKHGVAAARHFGLSWIITGGFSKISSTEFFAEALKQICSTPVIVIVLGDFDPGAWNVGLSFVSHLARYGFPCHSGPHYLIRPELFTEEELELFSRPLSPKDGRVDDWLAEFGGINGQPRGIHVDWLQPPERIFQTLDKQLQTLGIPERS